MVGKVPNKDWEEASSLAKELHAWRRQRLRESQPSQPPPSSSPSTPTTLSRAAAAVGGGQGHRQPMFGGDIAFNFNLDVRGEDDEDDELDRAFPGIFSGNGAGGFGGFAFDSFDSFVGNIRGGGGDGPPYQQQQPSGGEENNQRRRDHSGLEEKEQHHRYQERGGAAPAAAPTPTPSADHASFPAPSGKAAATAAVDAVDAGWLYSRCVAPGETAVSETLDLFESFSMF